MTEPRRLRTLIIDDEALARERLRGMLAVFPNVNIIGESDSGSTAVKSIVDERPDLVFLDVQMPGMDGFGVLRCVRSSHRPLIVFVTAYDEYAIRAFEVHAVDYLLKPVTKPRLAEAMRRVEERTTAAHTAETQRRMDSLLEQVESTPGRPVTIPVRTAAGVQLVNAGAVLWIEADADHVRIHEAGKTHSVREKLAEMEERLRPHHFARVHRSAIVNVAAVRSIEPIAKGDYFLTLVDGSRVRTSRQYRETVQALLK